MHGAQVSPVGKHPGDVKKRESTTKKGLKNRTRSGSSTIVSAWCLAVSCQKATQQSGLGQDANQKRRLSSGNVSFNPQRKRSSPDNQNSLKLLGLERRSWNLTHSPGLVAHDHPVTSFSRVVIENGPKSHQDKSSLHDVRDNPM